VGAPMTAIIPHLGDAVFGPDDIKAMSIALNDVCENLDLPDRAKAAREVLAQRIIKSRASAIPPAFGIKSFKNPASIRRTVPSSGRACNAWR
jgi:hypothetical protein